jgi:hypothetical protein
VLIGLSIPLYPLFCTTGRKMKNKKWEIRTKRKGKDTSIPLA